MEGFLWLNLSGGKNCVDNGRELFGIGTRLPDGNPATNGFQALAMYDDPALGGNGDDVINADDAVWNRLRVWVDANHDGACEPTEVSPIHAFGIENIPLNVVPTNFLDENGNGHFLRGRYQRHVKGQIQLFDIDAVTFQGRHH